MPDVDDGYARRGQLLPVLFWGGVSLAPLAGLLVLLGNGASLRAGAFLAVVALLLIGLSVALRPDPSAIRLQLEETLLEELDRLRAEVREDIAGASRATHQAIGERLGAMQQVIDSLRGERARYAAPRSAPPPAAHPAAPAAAAPPPGRYRPVASHPVPPYPVQPRSAPPVTAAAQRSAPPGAPAGRHPGPPPPVAPPPVAPPVAGNGQPVGGRRAARHQTDPPPEPVGGRATPPPPTGGVYRHTETVHVTTRSTYVDEQAPNGDGGRRYDGGSGGHEWSGVGSRGRAVEPYQESWTDQKLRERYSADRRPRPYDRAEEESGEQPWTRRSASWEEPVSATPVSGGRGAGRGPEEHRRHRHRWDHDESGELQLGQRRANARGDGNGSELRLEERWASFRRDDNGYGRADYRADGSDARDPDYSRPALPSSSDEPSWNDSWDEPVRASRGHRYQPDFELSDERWR